MPTYFIVTTVAVREIQVRETDEPKHRNKCVKFSRNIQSLQCWHFCVDYIWKSKIISVKVVTPDESVGFAGKLV